MNQRTEDLIVLAALGELTTEEQRELDALVASDPEVAAELDAEMETAATLLSSTPLEAPVSLRASVLGAIGQMPQDDPLAESSADIEAPPASSTSPVASLASAREKRTRRMAPILSAAAAVVLLVGGAIVLTGRDDSTGDEVAVVVEANDAVERVFLGLSEGELLLVHSASADAVALAGSGIGPLADAETYVLWLIRDGEATPAAEFRPDAAGDVNARFDNIDPSQAVLSITTEQIGNVTTPTEPILATA